MLDVLLTTPPPPPPQYVLISTVCTEDFMLITANGVLVEVFVQVAMTGIRPHARQGAVELMRAIRY